MPSVVTINTRIVAESDDPCELVKDVYEQLASVLLGGLRGNTPQTGGGIAHMLAVCMALFVCTPAHALSPVNDDEVRGRIRESMDMREWYENRHGTCTTNTALFLGAINLDQHRQFVTMVERRHFGVTLDELRAETAMEWQFLEIPALTRLTRGLRGGKTDAIIAQLRISMEDITGSNAGANGHITALVFKHRQTGVNHMVSLWIRDDGDMAVIDPQEWAANVLAHPIFSDATGTLSTYINTHVDTRAPMFLLMSTHKSDKYSRTI